MSIYTIDTQSYQSLFSFQSLQNHFQISDEQVVIVGTSKTKEVLGEYLTTYRFETVDENDLDAIFHKAVELIDEGDIIDLTQSFLSIPFGVLFSLSFSKSLGKCPKDILYAQAENNTCNPTQTPCAFRFVSLKKYDEMTDLARTINTFSATLLPTLRHRKIFPAKSRRHFRPLKRSIPNGIRTKKVSIN